MAYRRPQDCPVLASDAPGVSFQSPMSSPTPPSTPRTLMESVSNLWLKIFRRIFQKFHRLPFVGFYHQFMDDYRVYLEDKKSVSPHREGETVGVLHQIMPFFLFVTVTVMSFFLQIVGLVLLWLGVPHSHMPYTIRRRGSICQDEASHDELVNRLMRDSLALECVQLKEELRRVQDELETARTDTGSKVNFETLKAENEELQRNLQIAKNELDAVKKQSKNMLSGADHVLEEVQTSVQEREEQWRKTTEELEDVKMERDKLAKTVEDYAERERKLTEEKSELQLRLDQMSPREDDN